MRINSGFVTLNNHIIFGYIPADDPYSIVASGRYIFTFFNFYNQLLKCCN